MPGCKLPSGINTCVEEEMEKVDIEFGKLTLLLVGLSFAEGTLGLCYVK